MPFDIVVAVGPLREIAVNDVIPWDCIEDRAFFRNLTTSHCVIMGRKTWESLSRKLSSRINIVISSQNTFENSPDKVFRSLNDALEYASTLNCKIFVIGGTMLYTEAMNHSELRYIYYNIITYQRNFNKSDRVLYFPDFNLPIIHQNIRGNVEYRTYTFVNAESEEKDYLMLLKNILNADLRFTRNGTTRSLFAKTLNFDLSFFPLLTTKKMFLRGIFEELMWFLRGQTSSKILEDKGVNIWRDNTTIDFIKSKNLQYDEGDVGNMYGFQLRHFGETYHGCDQIYHGFDQIEYCLNLLRTDPFSRRIIMTTFDPSTADKGVLYPCHGICIQFYVREVNGKKYLDCSMTQRSSDCFLGLPFNIASYALLVYLFCDVLKDYQAGKLTLLLNDAHIYEDHIESVKIQLLRRPLPFPKLRFKKSHEDIRDYCFNDFDLVDYYYYPSIKAKMIA